MNHLRVKMDAWHTEMNMDVFIKYILTKMIEIMTLITGDKV